MFSFLKKAPKDESTILVSLVTSYAVTAAVVKIYRRPGTVQLPVVLFSCESILPTRQVRRAAGLESMVADAAMDALNQCRKRHQTYDELVCTIGEPWVTTSARVAHLERGEPFKVTAKTVKDLVAKETKLFEQEIVGQVTEIDQIGLLEVSEPLVDANGYRVRDYVGSLVQTLDVHLVFSLAQASVVDAMLGAFADVFHRTDVSFRSFDIAKMKLLQDCQHGVILEMGGLTTAVTVFEDAAASYFASIPVGLHNIEESLAEALGVPRSKISNALTLAYDSNVIAAERAAADAHVTRSYQSLGNDFALHVADIKKHVQRFEEPVIIIGQPSWLPVLASSVERDIGSSVSVPTHDLLRKHLLVAHDAHVLTNPLSLAILHAVRDQ